MIATLEKPLVTTADLSAVNNTALLTLYCRARETQTDDPILRDPIAVELMRQITPLIANSSDRLLRSLAKGTLEPQVIIHIALRAKKYDDYARQFLSRHPNGVVVNLGCGMDTRFQRLDDGQLMLFDLDLPEMISFKRQFLPPGGRYHYIPRSVFDYTWMDEVARVGRRPALFLAEGLLMYLEPGKVKALVLELRRRFPGSELVCELFNEFWLRQPWRSIAMGKMQRQLHIGKDAEFQFGVADSQEMESWGEGFRLLDDWSYFDQPHPKLGFLNWFTRFAWVRRVQWTAHYQLG
jgi:methyltransferase (TIGR00027 family)